MKNLPPYVRNALRTGPLHSHPETVVDAAELERTTRWLLRDDTVRIPHPDEPCSDDEIKAAMHAVAMAVEKAETLLARTEAAKLRPDAETGLKTHAALKDGRAKGADRNKKKAEERRAWWRKVASDMISRFPVQTLDDRVAYIQTLPSVGKMTNGKPYSARTIKDAIKGIRSEVINGAPSDAS